MTLTLLDCQCKAATECTSQRPAGAVVYKNNRRNKATEGQIGMHCILALPYAETGAQSAIGFSWRRGKHFAGAGCCGCVMM